ncbi:hypothetical protein WJX77_000232 [Trebouxia sp. C0004]
MTQGFAIFAVSVAVNFAIAAAVFIFFGVFRKSKFVSKYYAPRRYTRNGRKRPARLPYSFYKWIPIVYRYTQEEVIELSGMDAAMYLRVLMFGAELFFFLTIWCLIVVLPTNLSGHEVSTLMSTNNKAAYSNFTYWVPAPPPPSPHPSGAGSFLDATNSDQPDPTETPDMYADVPPAPPGLIWWEYRPGVPPLSQPVTYFGLSNWTNWGWRYDPDYIVPFYQYSNIDKTAMTNLSNGDKRFWVHLISTYVISWYVYKLMWRFNQEAVALRIQYLMNTKEGAESHTVLVTDIPVLEFGTIPHRIETTVFRYLPVRIKEGVKKIAKTGFGLANTGVNATIGRANKVLLHGETISLPSGLVGLPKNLSALPSNILEILPDIIARQRRGSKGLLSPKGSGLPPSTEAAHEAGDVVVDLNPGLSTKPSSGPAGLQTKLKADTARLETTLSADTAGLETTLSADTAGLETILSADTAGLDTTASSGIAASVVKRDSFKDAIFYDAKSTTLPVYGKRIGDADVIEGPMEAEPQEPETLEPGAGAGTQDVTELDAWQKCGALAAIGMSVQEITEREFEELFPGQVARVGMVHDTTALDPLVKEYQKVTRQLEDLLDEYIGRKKQLKKIKRKKVKVVGAKYGMWGLRKYGTTLTNVDALVFWPDRLACLADQIQVEQRRALKLAVPSAFVTFKTRRAQVIACSSLLHHDQRAWAADAAPNSEELVWANLGWRSWERQLRFVAVWAAFFALALFYIIPITAVQGLINVSRLETTPGLRTLTNLPVINGLITSFLPSVILRIFLKLLPNLLGFMSHVQGVTSLSQVDFGVLRKYFIFQVLTVFFGSFIAGSLLNQLNAIIHDPTTLVDILGEAAPQVAVFFMTYLLLMALSSKPIGFLRLVGLLGYYIKSGFASTARARARLWQNQQMSFGSDIPDHTMSILLGLGFSVVAPLIAPIGLLYFLVMLLIGKYQMVYVFTESYQSGGKIWRQAFDQIIVAVLIWQLLMIGLIGLKKAPTQAGLLVPLPIITIVFRVIAGNLFMKPQSILSLRGAADLDKREQEAGARLAAQNLTRQVEHDNLYESPAFRVSHEGLEELLAEVKRVDALIMAKPPGHPDVEAAAGEASEQEVSDSEEEFRTQGDEEFFPASSSALPDEAVLPEMQARFRARHVPISGGALKGHKQANDGLGNGAFDRACLVSEGDPYVP